MILGNPHFSWWPRFFHHPSSRKGVTAFLKPETVLSQTQAKPGAGHDFFSHWMAATDLWISGLWLGNWPKWKSRLGKPGSWPLPRRESVPSPRCGTGLDLRIRFTLQWLLARWWGRLPKFDHQNAGGSYLSWGKHMEIYDNVDLSKLEYDMLDLVASTLGLFWQSCIFCCIEHVCFGYYTGFSVASSIANRIDRNPLEPKQVAWNGQLWTILGHRPIKTKLQKSYGHLWP